MKYLEMRGGTPDILILPSHDLNFYVKEIAGCVCINPGTLIKSGLGGTFCSITLDPLNSENLKVKFLPITGIDKLYF